MLLGYIAVLQAQLEGRELLEDSPERSEVMPTAEQCRAAAEAYMLRDLAAANPGAAQLAAQLEAYKAALAQTAAQLSDAAKEVGELKAALARTAAEIQRLQGAPAAAEGALAEYRDEAARGDSEKVKKEMKLLKTKTSKMKAWQGRLEALEAKLKNDEAAMKAWQQRLEARLKDEEAALAARKEEDRVKRLKMWKHMEEWEADLRQERKDIAEARARLERDETALADVHADVGAEIGLLRGQQEEHDEKISGLQEELDVLMMDVRLALAALRAGRQQAALMLLEKNGSE